MLNQTNVDEFEETLRKRIRQLPEDKRGKFYTDVKKEIRDPDTYAALNWFFVTGLHHFYLGKWLHGSFDLAMFVVGIALIISNQILLGVSLILFVSIIEFWALFRSQIIVQDRNNRIYEKHLKEHEDSVA